MTRTAPQRRINMPAIRQAIQAWSHQRPAYSYQDADACLVGWILDFGELVVEPLHSNDSTETIDFHLQADGDGYLTFVATESGANEWTVRLYRAGEYANSSNDYTHKVRGLPDVYYAISVKAKGLIC